VLVGDPLFFRRQRPGPVVSHHMAPSDFFLSVIGSFSFPFWKEVVIQLSYFRGTDADVFFFLSRGNLVFQHCEFLSSPPL